MKTRIVKKTYCHGRYAYCNLYKIQEVVTNDGLYIEWPDSYHTIETAQSAIKKEHARTTFEGCE